METSHMINERATDFWKQYLATLPVDHPTRLLPVPPAWQFGDSPELADELGHLVYAGTKTATCASYWEYEADGDPLPQVGAYSIILDGRAEPICIIQSVEITIRPYDEVDAQFASEEGEGDRSLEHWRDGHWRFFGRSLQRIGKTPDLKMPLVCERFRLVFKVEQLPGV